LIWLAASLTGLDRLSAAGPAWPDVLAGMPLPSPAPLLNRDNAICVILEALRSNNTVKAIVVLPGVLNDFYLIHRDQPKLNLRAANLIEAVKALTNATSVRATFRDPFLLLHLDRDALQARFVVRDEATADELRSGHHIPRARYCDAHWERVQPELQRRLPWRLRPEAASMEAWHFGRHNFTGWGLSDWDLLAAVSLGANTSCIVQKQVILFQLQAKP
jgi:hypothetical protein